MQYTWKINKISKMYLIKNLNIKYLSGVDAQSQIKS